MIFVIIADLGKKMNLLGVGLGSLVGTLVGTQNLV